jgi:hypothetical protein
MVSANPHAVSVKLSVYAIATTSKHDVLMLRAAAVALVILIGLDWYFLDSQYVHVVAAMGHSLVHFVVG